MKKMIPVLVYFFAGVSCLMGVFGDEVKSVMEGNSVTLHNTDDIKTDDVIVWSFGEKDRTRIATVTKKADGISMTHDHDGMFRHRLQVDTQTGSLTITNITNQHSGVYQMIIFSGKQITKTFRVAVYAHLPVPVISRDSSQCSSSSSSSSKCVVLCSVVNVSHVSLSWYKGSSLLSSTSVFHLNNRLSLPLEVDYEDTNTHTCVLNNPIMNHTQHLHITEVCKCPVITAQSNFTLFILISCGAVVGSVIIAAALLICCICICISRKQPNEQYSFVKPEWSDDEDFTAVIYEEQTETELQKRDAGIAESR